MKELWYALSLILCLVCPLVAVPSTSLAQSDEDRKFLLMYFKEEELVVEAPTRAEKSLTQTAENISVVTAADIELMNAHTLADVLNTVTAVQVFMTGGPGQISQGAIQGSEPRHVTVLIDGVALNNLSDTVVDLAMIPVQMIEKVEIIKGPASSAWGSALGGVVNVVTKKGSLDNSGGMLSASYGKRDSGDFRAETRGKQDRFGYYLTAGRLQSDGLTPHFNVSDNNAYTKLTYDLTDKTTMMFTLGYVKKSVGQGLDDVNDLIFDDFEALTHSTLAVNSELSKDLALNVSVRTLHDEFTARNGQLSTGAILLNDKLTSSGYGSSAKLTWKNGMNAFVVGADYDDKKLKAESISNVELGQRKSALYANDTISFDKLAVTPGIRFDKTNTNGDATSPSLGITYRLVGSTILRAYYAEGFNIPPLGDTYGNNSLNVLPNPDLKVETVRSYQAGVETAALKFLWLKFTVFRNDIRNAFDFVNISDTTRQAVNRIRQRRQGTEVEARTAPVFNTSLAAGADFIDAKDIDTGERIQNTPTQVYDLGLVYDDERSFKGMLKGRYINWNAQPEFQAKYTAPIFDLNIIKKIYQHRDSSLEAFVNVHNIFNSSNYLIFIYPNPERWFEGGLRYTF